MLARTRKRPRAGGLSSRPSPSQPNGRCDEEPRMARVTTLGVRMSVFVAALLLGACSSTSLELPSQRMCEAAGGTYVGTTCNPAGANPRTAKQMCDAHGGTYVAGLDVCRMGGAK